MSAWLAHYTYLLSCIFVETKQIWVDVWVELSPANPKRVANRPSQPKPSHPLTSPIPTTHSLPTTYLCVFITSLTASSAANLSSILRLASKLGTDSGNGTTSWNL